MTADEEHEGASIKEQLIAACRGNNTDLLTELLDGKPDDEITSLLNSTTTVMGNYLYHEAASRGNYEIIDLLLDQPAFECDPVNRLEGDTPLHSAIRWLNAEPPAQRPFGLALVSMMLEAGSSPRARNRARLTPAQLVDPANVQLKELIHQHEYASQNAGDFAHVVESNGGGSAATNNNNKNSAVLLDAHDARGSDDDDDAEFSGSDDEERAEWERRRRERKGAR
ncbi:hypothetical protein JDV02_009831 [Purpureocillium takamizusanense]|uniref:Ankyrin repeat protein n=1 Tax=Purpureocillium takamizusanense TaxID=2060973 RepID=A0A9Q8QTA1_9HYPO|nr:uncharacterized protein JDV02_009831 [Purpureocillium takamizusanense]UNI24052.1 hypothetical protein JDV02_009831 [Purpureocillium takamizusanense]